MSNVYFNYLDVMLFNKKNGSLWNHRPQRRYGAIQIGPGLNFHVSGDVGWDFGGDERWWKG